MNTRREDIMGAINVKKFGLAWGSTFALLYVGCAVVMAVAGREGTIFLFNSMMHGIDVSGVIRMDVPVVEMILGIVQVFILGWLIGATVASIYNLSIRR